MKIYMVIGKFDPVVIDKARTKERAEAIIERYERQDRYEIEVEGYKFPEVWGGEYPRYYYGK